MTQSYRTRRTLLGLIALALFALNFHVFLARQACTAPATTTMIEPAIRFYASPGHVAPHLHMLREELQPLDRRFERRMHPPLAPYPAPPIRHRIILRSLREG